MLTSHNFRQTKTLGGATEIQLHNLQRDLSSIITSETIQYCRRPTYRTDLQIVTILYMYNFLNRNATEQNAELEGSINVKTNPRTKISNRKNIRQ